MDKRRQCPRVLSNVVRNLLVITLASFREVERHNGAALAAELDELVINGFKFFFAAT